MENHAGKQVYDMKLACLFHFNPLKKSAGPVYNNVPLNTPPQILISIADSSQKLFSDYLPLSYATQSEVSTPSGLPLDGLPKAHLDHMKRALALSLTLNVFD